jgi:hypothetical protein
MRIHAWLRSFHPCPKFNRGLVLDKKEKEKEIIRFKSFFSSELKKRDYLTTTHTKCGK